SGGSCRLHRSRDANRGFWVSHCCSWRARVPRKRVRVRGGEGMGDEGLGTAEIPPEGDQQEAACERDILEEVPEEVAAAAGAGAPEIAGRPELLPEQRCCQAIERHDQRGEPVGDA